MTDHSINNKDLFRNITQDGKGIESENICSSGNDSNDDLDAKLNINKKRHRNTIQVFDPLLQSVTHPFVLVLICIVVVVVFLVLRYTTLQTESVLLKKAAEDTEIFIKYFFTVVMTYIVTGFIENIKRQSDNESWKNPYQDMTDC